MNDCSRQNPAYRPAPAQGKQGERSDAVGTAGESPAEGLDAESAGKTEALRSLAASLRLPESLSGDSKPL